MREKKQRKHLILDTAGTKESIVQEDSMRWKHGVRRFGNRLVEGIYMVDHDVWMIPRVFNMISKQ